MGSSIEEQERLMSAFLYILLSEKYESKKERLANRVLIEGFRISQAPDVTRDRLHELEVEVNKNLILIYKILETVERML